MKVSELTHELIAEQCRIIAEDLTPVEVLHLDALKKAAIQYCMGYTGLTEEQLDDHEDITVAVLVTISDMYDNRQMYVDKAHLNRVVDTILGMYCFVNVPGEVVPDVN